MSATGPRKIRTPTKGAPPTPPDDGKSRPRGIADRHRQPRVYRLWTNRVTGGPCPSSHCSGMTNLFTLAQYLPTATRQPVRRVICRCQSAGPAWARSHAAALEIRRERAASLQDAQQRAAARGLLETCAVFPGTSEFRGVRRAGFCLSGRILRASWARNGCGVKGGIDFEE